MNKTEKLVLKSKKNFEKQYKKLYNRIYRSVHRQIRAAVRNGAMTVRCYSLYDIYKNFISEVANKVDQDIRETLVQEGFYVRKYLLGRPPELFEFSIAWGDSIKKYTNLDSIQLNLMEDRRKEYVKDN